MSSTPISHLSLRPHTQSPPFTPQSYSRHISLNSVPSQPTFHDIPKMNAHQSHRKQGRHSVTSLYATHVPTPTIAPNTPKPRIHPSNLSLSKSPKHSTQSYPTSNWGSPIRPVYSPSSIASPGTPCSPSLSQCQMPNNSTLYMKLSRKNNIYYYPKNEAMLNDTRDIYVQRLIGRNVYYENLMTHKLYLMLPDYEARGSASDVTTHKHIQSIDTPMSPMSAAYRDATSISNPHELKVSNSLNRIVNELDGLTDRYNETNRDIAERLRLVNQEGLESVSLMSSRESSANGKNASQANQRLAVDDELMSSQDNDTQRSEEQAESTTTPIADNKIIFSEKDAATQRYSAPQLTPASSPTVALITPSPPQDLSNRKLKKQLDESLSLNHRYKSICTNQQDTIGEQKQIIKDQSVLIQQLERDLNTLSQKNAELHARIRELNDSWERKWKNSGAERSERDKLKKENDMLQEEIEALIQEHTKELEEQAQQMEQKQSALRRTIQALEQDVRLKESERDMAMRKLATAESYAKDLTSKNDALSLQVVQLEKSSQLLSTKCDALKAENSELTANRNILTTEYNLLKNNAAQEKTTSTNSITAPTLPHEHLLIKKDEYNQLIFKHKTTESSLRDSNQSLKQELNALKARIKEREQTESTLKTQVQQKQQELSTLKSQLQKANESERSLQASLQKLKARSEKPITVHQSVAVQDAQAPATPTSHQQITTDDLLFQQYVDELIERRTKEMAANDTQSVDVAQKLSKEQYILNELLDTEKFYVESLTMVMEMYGKGLESLMDPNDYHLIFVPVENILFVNTSFYRELTRIYEEKNYFNIPALFIQYSLIWRIYSDYVLNYDDITAKLHGLRESIPEFSQKENDIEQQLKISGMRTVSMKSFFIMPIQRIPRYIMLLKDLRKKTAHEVFGSSLTRAIDAIEELARFCNEQKQKKSNRLKLQEVEEKLRLKNFSASKERQFEKEGSVIINGSNSKIYLFSDMLLVDQGGKKTYEIDLKDPVFTVNTVPDTPNAFRVELKRLEFVCVCVNKLLAESWISEIQKRRNKGEEVTLMEGIIKKQGDTRSTLFRKRYHVLSTHRMKYSKDGKLKGSYGVQNAVYGLHPKIQQGFTIQTADGSGRTFILKGETDEEVELWMDALSKVSGTCRMDPERECAQCGILQPKREFSNSQWKNRQGKCKTCCG